MSSLFFIGCKKLRQSYPLYFKGVNYQRIIPYLNNQLIMADAKRPPPASHGYINMIVAAIAALKEREGSSRQAIVNYIKVNIWKSVNVGFVDMALKRGLKDGHFVKGTGAPESYKLSTKYIFKFKPRKNKPATKKQAAKKPAAKKAVFLWKTTIKSF